MFEVEVAVISDVHGNRWALEAVLHDIARQGIQKIVNLGDHLYGPLDPAGTADILIQLNLPSVRGNEDRLIVEPSSESEDSPTLRYVKQSLRPEHLRWLEALPMTSVAYGDFNLCHGSPERDDEYLLEEVSATGVLLRKSSELLARLPSSEQPVLLCGHSHVPGAAYLPDGRLIVNPGSVGLPAYVDDLPFPHAMETGTPHARYSVVSRDDAGWRAEDVVVPYDCQSAAVAAQENGRSDWAKWLRTGRADVPQQAAEADLQ